MKIIIEGTQKEIADFAFALAIQNRLYCEKINPLEGIKTAVSSAIDGIAEAKQESHS